MTERYFADFSIPNEYQEIMAKYGLDETSILPSPQGLAFQESRYRRQFAAETGMFPGCAGEYGLILKELSQLDVRKLISFIPIVCQGPTCNAVGRIGALTGGLSMTTSHVYMSSSETLESPSELWEEMRGKHGGVPLYKSG